MDFLRKLFNNPPKTVLLILLVVGLFLAYGIFNKARAETTTFEVGPTFTSQFNGGFGIVLSERVLPRMDVGITLLSSQSWENVSVDNNGNFWAAFVTEKPENWWGFLPDEMYIGANYWVRVQEPINGCHAGYKLGMKWLVKDRYSVGVRHWSNSGICKPNRGQDLLTFGVRF